MMKNIHMQSDLNKNIEFERINKENEMFDSFNDDLSKNFIMNKLDDMRKI